VVGPVRPPRPSGRCPRVRQRVGGAWGSPFWPQSGRPSGVSGVSGVDFAAALEGPTERQLVRILEVATYGQAAGDPGDPQAERLEQSSKLVVPDPMAPEPRVEGRSVMVVEVLNIQPTGKREWELQPVEPGRTVLHGARPYPYTITLDVVP
jgi:hypothetical protein